MAGQHPPNVVTGHHPPNVVMGQHPPNVVAGREIFFPILGPGKQRLRRTWLAAENS